MVKILKNIWNSNFSYIYKISLKKNWTTLNFLKILYYISIWIVLLYISFEFFFNRNFDFYINLTVIEFLLEVGFDFNYDSVYDYGFMYPNDSGSCHFFWNFYEYAFEMYNTDMDSSGLPVLYTLIGQSILKDETMTDLFLNNEFNIKFHYVITNFIFNSLIILLYSWIFLVILFIFIHIYFSLNNVFKDYVRDIDITLQLFYFFLSIIILLNIFYLCYYFSDILNDFILINIFRLNFIYIFFYLFINFILSKNKKTFINLLKYLGLSIIGFILFLLFVDFILISLTTDIFFFSGWATWSVYLYGLAYDIGYVTICNISYFIINDIIFEFLYCILYNLLY